MNLKNIIITSTSETYGTAQYVPIDENHPVVGQSPYSATKIATDQLAISYYKSFNLPDFINKLHENKKGVIGYIHQGYWLHIGRPKDYERACLDYEEKKDHA